jgi:aminopeptidase N
MSLPKIAGDRKTREMIEQLLDDSDPIVRVDVVRALGEMGDVKARPSLRDRLEIELDTRVRRRIREVLRDLAEPRRASEQLRDELEKLQAEHVELKVRLATVEARVGGAAGGAKSVASKPARGPGSTAKNATAKNPTGKNATGKNATGKNATVKKYKTKRNAG